MKRIWLFLSNQFEHSTRGSYERALTMSTFTDAALAADPTLAAEYAFYHPLHLAYVAAYSAWKSGRGSQKGATASLKSLLRSLKQQLDIWDYQIQDFAPKGSSLYLSLFPNGRNPFYKGKQSTKIAAVGTLSVQLGKQSPVPSVKELVDFFLNELTAVNTTQKGKMSVNDTLSDAVEDARIAICQGLYYVLGKLMVIHYKNPEPIANYFDLELIRSDKQESFTGSVRQGKNHSIVQRGMKLDALVGIYNKGLVALTFFFAKRRNGAMPAGVTGVTLLPSEKTHVPASALGNPVTDKYLSVYNASEIVEGEWEVEIN